MEFLLDPATSLTAEGAAFVIANLSLRFVSEAHWPGRVDIGSGITKIGTSSIGLAQGIFQDGRCVATAETGIVQMNEATRKSHPLSDTARALLDRRRIG